MSLFFKRSCPHGFTLIELVLVLVILAIVATAALNVVDIQVDQNRFEATRDSLEATVEAIVGDRERPQVQNFVSDCGRLPIELEELVIQPAALTASQFFDFDSDRDGRLDVRLRGGWAGPYVENRAGFPSPLVDGWGRDFELVSISADEINLLSRGRNGATIPDETDYDEDVVSTLTTENFRYSATFILRATDGVALADPAPNQGNSEKLGILIYGVNVNPGTPNDGSVDERTLLVPFPGTTPDPEQPIDFQYSIEPNDPISIAGQIAVRGVIWQDNNDDDMLDNEDEPVIRSSVVHYFDLFGNDSLIQELVLR